MWGKRLEKWLEYIPREFMNKRSLLCFGEFISAHNEHLDGITRKLFAKNRLLYCMNKLHFSL